MRPEYLYLEIFPQCPAVCEIICPYAVSERHSLFNCRHFREDYS